jgi:predicted nucleotidyltransferase
MGFLKPQAIERILERIVKEYAPERIILFGSYAYGEPDEESDVDLLIIKETDQRPIARWVEVKRLLRDRSRIMSISPLVYTPREVEERLALGDPFLREALERGETLYERSAGIGSRVV